MTKEQKQEFTLRISQANKSGLVVILYDIFLAYLQDALDAVAEKNTEQYHVSVKKARDTIGELMHSLNSESSLSGNYASLYGFTLRQLTKADSSKDTKILRQLQTMVASLRETYEKVSKSDTEPAVMGNVQSVYAGLTYGKNNLTENLDQPGNRGFLA